MKKQIFTYFGLYFSLINTLSFPMERLLEPPSHSESSSITVNSEQTPCQRYIESASFLRQQNNKYDHGMDIEYLLKKYLENKKTISVKLQNISLPFPNSQTSESSSKHNEHADISYIPDPEAIKRLISLQQLLSRPNYTIGQLSDNNNPKIKSFLVKCLYNQTATLEKISNFLTNNPILNKAPTKNQQEARDIDRTSHTESSEAHNVQPETQVDTSGLLSDEEAQRFITSAPSPKARRIINMIMTRCLKTSPNEGSLVVSFIGKNGTGKTSLIKAIIATLKRPFAFISADDVRNKDQQRILLLIEETIEPFLEKDSPCVVAFDDIDKFYSSNKPYTENLKPDELLSYYINKAEAKDKNRHNPHFIFLASANEPKKLSDRFCSRSTIVEIGKPDYSSRFQILKSLITKKSVNFNDEKVKDLAQKAESLSIKNIKELIGFSILLNDTNDIPYHYLSKTRIEQMLKELLPEEEISSVKNTKEESQEKGYSHLILEKLGSFIKSVGIMFIQAWIDNKFKESSTPKTNQETPKTNQGNSTSTENKTN